MGKKRKKKEELIVVEHAIMIAEEDRYEEGVVGPSHTVWEAGYWIKGYGVIGLAEDWADLIDILRGVGAYVPADQDAWIAFEDGRMDCQYLAILSSGEYFPVERLEWRDKAIADWKQGKRKLYAITVSVLIRFADVHVPSVEEISKTFHIEEG